jgi:muramoyltetrapeptide carboxypeptidase
MIKQPPYLKKGDQVAIVCPAKKLPQRIDDAVEVLKEWGLEVLIGESVYASENQFAGSDELRSKDLQRYLDDPNVKAIISARGGYGTIRIIDELDFTAFCQHPKWIVGFSDITVLLSHILELCNVMGIHGQMPYTFADASPASLESLRKALFGEPITYEYSSSFENKPGTAEGILIGGNLTMLVMVEGSVSEMDYTDKILFIEDVGEQEYAIDRMMRMLKRAGKLSNLKGLIVGAFSGIEQEKIPFGLSPEEIILDLVKDYDYPVCFGFPTGHIDDNRAMVLGAEVLMSVQKNQAIIQFKDYCKEL